MLYGQRELMLKLFAEFGGDREKVLRAYAEADTRGEVRRDRNSGNTSSREYAVRLWANGVNRGWLTASPQIRTSKLAPSRSTSTPNDLLSQIHSINPVFEDGLRVIAQSWKSDPKRPNTTPEAREHWKKLIEEWCDDPEMPLPIRKSGNRGILLTHPSGRKYVLSDNSPAQWSFMGCFAGHCPSVTEVRGQMDNGVFPFSFARSRSEKLVLESGDYVSYGGFIGKSIYGQVNRFPDGKAYKLCHIEPVGLMSRGEVSDFALADLKDHVRRLLDPSNMFVVPLRYSGIGECEAFVDVFRSQDEFSGP